MATTGLWIGFYLLVLALIINTILRKWQKRRKEGNDRQAK